MRKLKYCLMVVCFLLVGIAFLGERVFHRNVMNTADIISLKYSRSASSFPSPKGKFYIHDNVLYFIEERDSTSIIRYVKNNRICTFAKLPEPCERFVVLNDKSVIVEVKNSIYLLNASDGRLMELWQGDCLSCYENQVYFTDNTTLYTAKIDEREPREVISFDELLASYHDGIVYRNGDGIYQLLFGQSNEPKSLTASDIAWSNDESAWLIGYEYLYTPNYALRISSYAIDMYVYKTGEIQRLYEVDKDAMGGMVLMAVTARENEFYVSRQYTDLKFWRIEDKEINGTYKYCIREGVWTKITNKVYSAIEQFDKQHLYGINSYGVYGEIKMN